MQLIWEENATKWVEFHFWSEILLVKWAYQANLTNYYWDHFTIVIEQQENNIEENLAGAALIYRALMNSGEALPENNNGKSLWKRIFEEEFIYAIFILYIC